MKTDLLPLNFLKSVPVVVLLLAISQSPAADTVMRVGAAKNDIIQWSELGAKAGVGYQGDGLRVDPTATGARLRCVFQHLEGEVKPDGLWLTSTAAGGKQDLFHVKAASVGRTTVTSLATTGKVVINGNTVAYVRPGLTEEYTVSVDGLRQDFVVGAKPKGAGKLCVRLVVTGAGVEGAGKGAVLVLKESGRRIAYNRLRVVDATGRELAAQLARPEIDTAAGWDVLVEDSGCTYPVRIDPTFSDANWSSLSPSIPGANGEVWAVATDAAGNLYIGGNFTVVGNVFANYIAKWDGAIWSALGSGMNSSVNALAVNGTDIYAGGSFSSAGGTYVSKIAKWNGSTWSALGSGVGGTVHALAVSGTNVYAGGEFTTAGGSGANYVARWDGSAWSALGTGMGSYVYALAVAGTNLYAGGLFTTAGGATANRVARWNGSAWSALSIGVNNNVFALVVQGTNLYAGGDFSTAGAVSASRVARWNGASWSALGTGVNNTVEDLVVSGTDLYAVGWFTTAGGGAANRIAKWDGGAWSAVGAGVNQPARAVAMTGTMLFVGGGFSLAGTNTALAIAAWDGSQWNGMATGMDNVVSAIAVLGSDVYVAGSFTSVGGISAKRIARWNGSTWSALGEGLNAAAYVLATANSNLFVGGSFTTAGGMAANRIAKWDGGNWSALGSGLNEQANAIVSAGSNLYVGGFFTTAGGVAANHVAKWDGSNWSAVGGGMNNYVLALATLETNLYAGGGFTMAEGNEVFFVAKWDGSQWMAMGAGMDAEVKALTVCGADIYAGGNFATADGVSAKYVARWNGSTWSALGTGLNFWVSALACAGTNLYAGGYFTSAGGNTANYIAKWDGASWSPLGSGMNHYVYGLAAAGTHLYAGGLFTAAGGKVSGYIAQADLGTPPNIVTQPQSQSVVLFTNATFNASASGTAPLFYQWQFNGLPVPDATNALLTLTNVTPANEGFYQLIVANDYGAVTSSVATLTVLCPDFVFTPASLSDATNGYASSQTIAATYSGQSLSDTLVYGIISGTLPTGTALSTNGVLAGTPAVGGIFNFAIGATNQYGCTGSKPYTWNIYSAPTASIPGAGNMVIGASGFTLGAAVTGSEPLSYQWRLNGTNLAGAYGSTLTVNSGTVANAGNYDVIVSNPYGSVTSSIVVVSFFGDLQFYAGTTVAGAVGTSFRVDYADVIGGVTNAWQTLTNVTLPYSPYVVIDPASPGHKQRFYRAQILP